MGGGRFPSPPLRCPCGASSLSLSSFGGALPSPPSLWVVVIPRPCEVVAWPLPSCGRLPSLRSFGRWPPSLFPVVVLGWRPSPLPLSPLGCGCLLQLTGNVSCKLNVGCELPEHTCLVVLLACRANRRVHQRTRNSSPNVPSFPSGGCGSRRHSKLVLQSILVTTGTAQRTARAAALSPCSSLS